MTLILTDYMALDTLDMGSPARLWRFQVSPLPQLSIVELLSIVSYECQYSISKYRR
jgi:hypothetical protein